MGRGRRAGRAARQGASGDAWAGADLPPGNPGPRRRCVGCRRSRPQAELLRLAARDGAVVPDPGRRVPGRGCYLCRDARCAEQAAKGRQIARALKGRVAEPPAERLLGWLSLDGARA